MMTEPLEGMSCFAMAMHGWPILQVIRLMVWYVIYHCWNCTVCTNCPTSSFRYVNRIRHHLTQF
jgi:hypothetical protein